jgi:hypothetical protein
VWLTDFFPFVNGCKYRKLADKNVYVRWCRGARKLSKLFLSPIEKRVLIRLMMVWQCKAKKVTSVLSAYTRTISFRKLRWTLGTVTSEKQFMFCRLTKCNLLKCMFTLLNRQTQSKNATLELTYKEIQLYCVRKQTDQLRFTRLDCWQRIASIYIDLFTLRYLL